MIASIDIINFWKGRGLAAQAQEVEFAGQQARERGEGEALQETARLSKIEEVRIRESLPLPGEPAEAIAEREALEEAVSAAEAAAVEEVERTARLEARVPTAAELREARARAEERARQAASVEEAEAIAAEIRIEQARKRERIQELGIPEAPIAPPPEEITRVDIIETPLGLPPRREILFEGEVIRPAEALPAFTFEEIPGEEPALIKVEAPTFKIEAPPGTRLEQLQISEAEVTALAVPIPPPKPPPEEVPTPTSAREALSLLGKTIEEGIFPVSEMAVEAIGGIFTKLDKRLPTAELTVETEERLRRARAVLTSDLPEREKLVARAELFRIGALQATKGVGRGLAIAPFAIAAAPFQTILTAKKIKEEGIIRTVEEAGLGLAALGARIKAKPAFSIGEIGGAVIGAQIIGRLGAETAARVRGPELFEVERVLGERIIGVKRGEERFVRVEPIKEKIFLKKRPKVEKPDVFLSQRELIAIQEERGIPTGIIETERGFRFGVDFPEEVIEVGKPGILTLAKGEVKTILEAPVIKRTFEFFAKGKKRVGFEVAFGAPPPKVPVTLEIQTLIPIKLEKPEAGFFVIKPRVTPKVAPPSLKAPRALLGKGIEELSSLERAFKTSEFLRQFKTPEGVKLALGTAQLTQLIKGTAFAGFEFAPAVTKVTEVFAPTALFVPVAPRITVEKKKVKAPTLLRVERERVEAFGLEEFEPLKRKRVKVVEFEEPLFISEQIAAVSPRAPFKEAARIFIPIGIAPLVKEKPLLLVTEPEPVVEELVPAMPLVEDLFPIEEEAVITPVVTPIEEQIPIITQIEEQFPIQEEIPIVEQISIQEVIPIEEQIPLTISIQRVRERQREQALSIFGLGFGFEPFPAPGVVSAFDLGFGFDRLFEPRKRKKKKKRVRRKRPFGVTPSLFAILADVRGPVPKRQVFTGLEIRPVFRKRPATLRAPRIRKPRAQPFGLDVFKPAKRRRDAVSAFGLSLAPVKKRGAVLRKPKAAGGLFDFGIAPRKRPVGSNIRSLSLGVFMERKTKRKVKKATRRTKKAKKQRRGKKRR